VRQMRRERSARSSDERHRSTRQLMSLREAIAEQRRLGRL